MGKLSKTGSPEVTALLAGQNPFVYSNRNDVFKEIFDNSERILRKDDDEQEKIETSFREKSSCEKLQSMLKQNGRVIKPENGLWKWDKKLGLLFVPMHNDYAEARNESCKMTRHDSTLKIAGKLHYKPHRDDNDKVVEGFAKLIDPKEKNEEVIYNEDRQVELRDVKRGAIHLNKYSLQDRIPDNVARYYDSFYCARGVRLFMEHEIYNEFLLSLIHYMYFYLLGLTEKYFRLGIKKGRMLRMPPQLEIPLSKKREKRRKIFRYEYQSALMELAEKYITLLYNAMKGKRSKHYAVVPERFFFESLLNVSCMAICVTFLQRSNRLIRTEFGRLFRREAFNTDSLERRIECTAYETYSDRALRVFEQSRHEKLQKQLAEKLKPRLSPMSERTRFSDPLAKPEVINWSDRIAEKPKIWTLKKKLPFYIKKASVPDKTDYVSGKHRVAVEQRQNSPLIELILGQDNQDLRDNLLHTIPELADRSLLAKMRPLRDDIPRFSAHWLTPYHKTLGILGKPLYLFDYWTLLPAMNNEKKLTLPGLTRDARYRAFKTMRLLFPQRLHHAKMRNSSGSQGHVKEETKDFPERENTPPKCARSTRSFLPNKIPVKVH